MKRYLLLVICLLFLQSCDTTDVVLENTGDTKLVDYVLPKVNTTPAHVHVFQDVDKNRLLSKKVTIVAKNITVLKALQVVDPNLTINNDINQTQIKTIDIRFINKSFGEYLNYLSNLTGYSIYLTADNVIKIKRIGEKTWNLAGLSMSSIALTESAQNNTSDTNSDQLLADTVDSQDWDKILTHITTIAGEGAIIVDDIKVGNVTVIAQYDKLKLVDSWLKSIQSLSQKQIHLHVQVLDVLVDESVGRGINWDLLADNGNINIGSTAQTTIDSAGVLSFGNGADTLWQLTDSANLSILLDFLRKQGKVNVQNQPNVTVQNGNSAYLSTGDEFSYVASVQSTPDSNGNVVTTSDVQRMNIGVDLKVTAKVLDDDRVVLNIVPVISSLKSYTQLSSGSGDSQQTFQTPNIALQKLSTQVIARSGATIHLGGLIAEKIASASKGLDGGVFDFLFKGVKKEFERREIVILVKPTILG